MIFPHSGDATIIADSYGWRGGGERERERERESELIIRN